MTQDTIVEFDSVSKKFSLHRGRARSFQELMVGMFRRGGDAAPLYERQEDFWALKDVSFTIHRGETVGIIGPNGAGKSTALKLLTRIIEPTSGRVAIHGRVGALLELGAGFHPDLTGRENIYLNGSILGLSRAEIEAKLDEIIAFSELERFIDMPVKHYSSGMYVRLGFSVAVHTDPEVLLVDEVLSVGDAAFQRKCMERISDLRRDGMTIVLVSHGLETVQTFCSTAIWLDGGQIQAQGDVTDVAMDYTAAMAKKHTVSGHRTTAQTSETEEENPRRWGTGRLQITNVELYDGNGQTETTFATGEPLEVRLHYHAAERVKAPVFGIAIHHQNGTHICGPNTQQLGYDIPAVEGEGVVCYRIPALNLLAGSYLISAAAVNETNSEIFDHHDRMYPFRVYRGTCREVYGLVSLRGGWDIADGEGPWLNN